MKHILAVLTAISLVLSLAGCSGVSSGTSQSTGTDDSQSLSTTDLASSEAESTVPEEVTLPWEWEYDTPENHGVNTSDLESIHAVYDTIPLYTAAIIKDGVVIDTYYKDGYDSTSVLPLHSVTKSITSALVGIAIEEGKIPAVDAKLYDYFPEVLEKQDTRWNDITLWHLLTHTSGIETTDSSIWGDWRASDDWTQYVLDLPIVSDPGTEFSYSTGNTHLLAAIVEKAAGETLSDYAQEHIFDPLGMESARIDTAPEGVGDGGNGGYMTVLDMARFGLMYLQGGMWQGKQIVPADWVQDSTALQFDRSTGTADYGCQWWVRTFRGHAAYFAQGFAGQFIFVVPDLQLVITMQSDYTGSSAIYWQLAGEITRVCE